MTLAVLSKSNFLSQGFTNIYDIVNNRTYVPDPLSPNGGRKFVYMREPNPKSPSFAGFPFIVVEQPGVVFPNKSTSGKRKVTQHSMLVRVYSTDRLNMNQTNGMGVQYLNSISDDLVEAFNSSTVKEVLRPYRIDNLSINTSGSDVEDLDEDVVFIREFEITFANRRDVW